MLESRRRNQTSKILSMLRKQGAPAVPIGGEWDSSDMDLGGGVAGGEISLPNLPPKKRRRRSLDEQLLASLDEETSE